MFFEFGIKDLIDIFLVATMLYYIYRLMRESRSLNVFIGILVFYRYSGICHYVAVRVAYHADETAWFYP